MARQLSNLVINLAEEIHKMKCKNGHGKKKVKSVELNTKITTVFFNTKILEII